MSWSSGVSSAALTVRELRVAYGDRQASRGVSFAIQPGEVVAIVGGAGAGKSTVAKAIMGLLPSSTHVAGTITFQTSAAGAGGRRQVRTGRVGSVACSGFELTIVDEPSVSFGESARRMLDLVEDARFRAGSSVVILTRDIALAIERADRILVLRNGEIVDAGTTRKIATQPRHPYTQELLDGVGNEGKHWDDDPETPPSIPVAEPGGLPFETNLALPLAAVRRG